MSVITLPVGLAVAFDGGVQWGQQRHDLAGMADSGGSTQVRPLGPPRWTVTLRAPQGITPAEAGPWRSLLLKARGRVNHIAVYNVVQPAPRGTLRGTPRLQYAVAAGDTSMTLVGGTAGTSFEGDAYQLGSGVGTSQLVHIVADATSSPATEQAFTWDNSGAFTCDNSGTFTWSNPGTITLTFEPPARIGFALDTLVVWDKPVAYFKQVGDSSAWGFWGTKAQTGLSFDGIEDWTP